MVYRRSWKGKRYWQNLKLDMSNWRKGRWCLNRQRTEICKTGLAALAEEYASSKVDRTGFPLNVQHLKTIKNLKRQKDSIISRPDKGEGVVLMDRTEYEDKMMKILSQDNKFQCIGDMDQHDRTLQHERSLQAFLLRARRAEHISKAEYDRARPVGSSCPILYGVSKIHKKGNPLRLIVSMVKAPQHQLAKWLSELLDPVVRRYSMHTVQDSYDFGGQIKEYVDQYPDTVEGSYMCSFDVTSLFTNVPLDETIDIAIKTLFHDETNHKAENTISISKTHQTGNNGCGIYIQPQNVQANTWSSNGIPSRTGFGEYIQGILPRQDFKRTHATFL